MKFAPFYYLLAIAVIGLILGIYERHIAYAQNAKAPATQVSSAPAGALVPTHEETLEIELEEERAAHLNDNLNEIYARYQQQNAIVEATIAAVKKAHGWGDDVTYDRKQHAFIRAAAKHEAK